jgi:hypothetical protein
VNQDEIDVTLANYVEIISKLSGVGAKVNEIAALSLASDDKLEHIKQRAGTLMVDVKEILDKVKSGSLGGGNSGGGGSGGSGGSVPPINIIDELDEDNYVKLTRGFSQSYNINDWLYSIEFVKNTIESGIHLFENVVLRGIKRTDVIKKAIDAGASQLQINSLMTQLQTDKI